MDARLDHSAPADFAYDDTLDPIDMSEALADLFLDEPHPHAASHVAGPASIPFTQEPRREPGAHAQVEAVLLGHLPVRSAPWVGQYAREVAGAINACVGLVRVRGDRLWIELVGGPSARIGTLEVLDDALAYAQCHAAHWIVQVGDLEESRIARDRAIDRLTLLLGHNEVALVAGYRTLKLLAHERPDTNTELGVAVVGGDEDDAEHAIQRLRDASDTFLEVGLSHTLHVRGVRPSASHTVYCGPFKGDGHEIVERLRTEVVPAPPESSTTPRLSREPEPTGAHEAVDSAPNEDARVESGGLVSLVRALTSIEPRCPDEPEVELALDTAGRLHALRRTRDDESAAEAVGALVAVTAWAKKHASLISMAIDGTLAFRADDTPTLHVFTGDAREARSLLDADVRVHLLVDASQVSRTGTFCTPLN
ncbi:MAG: hypothetical protein AAGD00_08485 [Planctomycetota bacterium]